MRVEFVVLAVVAVGLFALNQQKDKASTSTGKMDATTGSVAPMANETGASYSVNWKNPAGLAARAGKATVAGIVGGVRNIPANVGAEIAGARAGGQLGSNIGGVFGAGTAGGLLGASAGAIVGGVADSAKVGTQAALQSFFGA